MITSVSNPKIKNVIKLKENSKERRKQKSFIIYVTKCKKITLTYI